MQESKKTDRTEKRWIRSGRVVRVMVGAALVGGLATAGAGCVRQAAVVDPSTEGPQAFVQVDPGAATAVGFNAPNQQSQFVALAGTALPDEQLPAEPKPTPPPTAEEVFGQSQGEHDYATPSSVSPSVPLVSEVAPPPTAYAPAPSPSDAPLQAVPPSSGNSASSVPSSPGVYSDSDSVFAYAEEPYLEGYPYNTEEYSAIDEHGFMSVAANPLSTFSADVDTASYANLRRMINDGAQLRDIPSGAVRIEEMLNYFSYDFITPVDGEPFAMNAQIADCPWNPDTNLMVVGVQAQLPPANADAGSNLVFLIDVSGSMREIDKLPLLQESFSILVKQLTENDRVSIVTYASGVRLVLEGAHGDDKGSILNAIYGLEAGGSTNGESGLLLAYEQAEANFIEGGVNRIIMASDGDLNVGASSESALNDFVSGKRQTGVYLSVLGFGTGNFKDNKMETLADNGNGNYSYIDSIDEARKVFEEDLTANMVTVADDVKLQLEFNPAYVKGYRQIGYENRALAAEDFLDDTKDAAEMGAGHQVIVVYEIVMADSAQEVGSPELRYQTATEGVENGEWLTIALRYKDPGAPVSKGISYVLDESAYTDEPDEDWVFISGIIEFGMIASHSDNVGTASLREAASLVELASKDNPYRLELAELIQKLI